MNDHKFKAPYKSRVVKRVVLAAVDSPTAAFAVAVPVATQYEITAGARFVTTTKVATIPLAADIAVIEVSCDGGVSWFVPGSTAGTAVTIIGNAKGRLVITDAITNIRTLTNASLGGDETQLFNIMCIE